LARSLTQRQVAELHRSRRGEFKIGSDICDCLCASVRTDGVTNEVPPVVLLKRRGRLGTTSISNIHYERAVLKNWRPPGNECGDGGGTVGENVGVIPVNVEDQGRVCGVRVKVSSVFVCLHDEALLSPEVDW
jgi:hypothetical protein